MYKFILHTHYTYINIDAHTRYHTVYFNLSFFFNAIKTNFKFKNALITYL